MQDQQPIVDRLNLARTILIYGLGIEGESSLAYFRKHYPEARISIYDQNNPKYSKTRNLKNFDCVVVSPGVDRKKLEFKDGQFVTSNSELFFGLLPIEAHTKILAVTGTKGKSTTVKFLYELLVHLGFSVEVGGNYGLAMLGILEEIDSLDYVVLEFSSFQLENLKASPHFAGFVNLYEDHLDRHGSMSEYFAAKANIFKYQKSDDKLFLPYNYDTFLEPARSIFTAMVNDGESRVVVTEPVPAEYFLEHSILRAGHIRANLGIVAEMVRLLTPNLADSESQIQAFCQIFEPLPHRLEFVAEIGGKTFINDSQSTNQYSTIAGMQAFGERLGTLILGGKDKGNRYDLLIDELLKLHPFVILLNTEVGNKVKELLEKTGFEHYVIVNDFASAVELGYQFTEPGKICLMSPAGASFDWFVNYKDRGDQFKALVFALESK